MEYTQKSIDDIQMALLLSKITSEDLFLESIHKARKFQEDYNAFVTILTHKEEMKASTPLSGIPYALKDNFSTSGILTTASSSILKDYVPVFDATVYRKLKEAGAVLMGKTVLDELAMGGTGTTGHTGVVRNPWDKERLMGGSSAGSAAAVALGIVPFSIGSDTGDSVRKPAAFGGLVGFKPTYGRISRYGLFPFASSLDHVGIFARNVKDVTYVTDVLKGYDEHDMTSLKDDACNYVDTLEEDIKGKKLFYIEEVCKLEQYIDTKDEELIETLRKFHETIEHIQKMGIEVTPVSIDKSLLNAIYPAYMSISCAEATSNNANLTGISFGVRGEGNSIDSILFDARTKGFSEFIKRRFVLGSYILQKENQEKLFLNALRVRRMIVDKITELFQIYDGLIMPTSGGVAPLFGTITDQLSDRYLLLENHLAIGNFGGFPSISIPSGLVHKMPIGINITGPILKDASLLNIAYQIEDQLGYKNMVVGGENHV